MATRVTIGVTGVLFVLGALAVDWSDAADRSTSTGVIDSEGLGRMLRSVGVKPRAAGSRYDFEFHSKQGGQEWDFAMSAVISQNGGTIWVMAWREEMLQHAQTVSDARTLLADERQVGEASTFSPSEPIDVTQYEGEIVSKEVVIDASVQTPDDQTEELTLTVTLERAELIAADGSPLNGRWIITRIDG